jgi:glycerol kinase
LSLSALKVDGGASANNLMMQFQADTLGVEIVRPAMVEATALGAALLAGIGSGLWKDIPDAAQAWKLAIASHAEQRFRPTMARAEVEALLTRWHQAVERA